MSSWASQRANSTDEKSDSSAVVSRSLVTAARQTSRFSPRGTKYVVLAAMPARADLIVVYDSPCRHSYSSSGVLVGCQDGDQNSPVASSRR